LHDQVFVKHHVEQLSFEIPKELTRETYV
jgi:hypothetical protein